MNFGDWLKKWNMTSLKINAGFMAMEFSPSEDDKDAAWRLYIELLTRITTQRLPPGDGNEDTALNSIFSLFATTRKIIIETGRGCGEFTKVAVVILNQKVRPFTAKWHKIATDEGFRNKAVCKEFRSELNDLQDILKIYS